MEEEAENHLLALRRSIDLLSVQIRKKYAHEWLTEKQAIQYLNCGTTWLWELRRSGELPFSKIKGKVFYRLADIHNLLESNLNSISNDLHRT